MAPKAKRKTPSKKAKKKAAPQKSKAVMKKAKAVVKKAKVAVRKAAAAVKTVAARKLAPGHRNIAAGLTANDAAASIQWYTDVLGFEVIERWENEGQFMGAQIGSGDITLHIGQDDWKMGRDRVKGQGTRLYITTTKNIDQYAADIKARGGILEQEPADGWGVRAFSIADPDGFKFTFMSPKK